MDVSWSSFCAQVTLNNASLHQAEMTYTVSGGALNSTQSNPSGYWTIIW